MDDLVTDNVALAKRAWSWLDTDRDWTTGATAELQQLYFELLDQDAVLIVDRPENSTVYRKPIRGKQALIDMYRTAPCWLEDNRLERPLEFIGSGDLVLALGSERFTLKEDGHTLRNKEFVILMDFRNGRIARLYQFQGMTQWSSTNDVDGIERIEDAIPIMNESAHKSETGDRQPFLNLLAEDVILKAAGPEPIHVFRGNCATAKFIRSIVSQLQEHYLGWQKPSKIVDIGSRVIILGCARQALAAGERDYALIVDFRDELVARIVAYCQ